MGLLCAGFRHCCWREGFLHSGGFRTIFNLSDEAVAVPRLRLYESGLFGRIAQRIAQLPDAVVQTLFKIDEGVGGPNLALKFIAGDEFSGMFQQDLQDVERLVLKPDPKAVLADFALTKIHFECAEADDLGGWSDLSRAE